ncbi:MAG: DUF4398 domain-containing protein [Pseudomonadota bacterium]
MKKSLKVLLVSASLGLAACGTKYPPPDSQMNMATSEIGQAESIGAYESAPLELKSARDKLEQAKQAVQREDNLAAKRLAEQAIVDANLAQAKARTAKSQKTVEELKASIQTLQDELNRTAR